MTSLVGVSLALDWCLIKWIEESILECVHFKHLNELRDSPFQLIVGGIGTTSLCPLLVILIGCLKNLLCITFISCIGFASWDTRLGDLYIWCFRCGERISGSSWRWKHWRWRKWRCWTGELIILDLLVYGNYQTWFPLYGAKSFFRLGRKLVIGEGKGCHRRGSLEGLGIVSVGLFVHDPSDPLVESATLRVHRHWQIISATNLT